jgi:hypothetical protein
VTLPELRTGDILRCKRGFTYTVQRVSRPRQDHEYDEPVYRLRDSTTGVLGRREWHLDELQEMEQVEQQHKEAVK